MKPHTILLLLLLAAHNAHSETVTGYCACPKCCGKGAKGITAAGTRPMQGRTVAAPRNVPLGTKVLIDGKPFTVEDRTARRFDGRWDIYFERHQDAKNFGKRKLKVQ